MGDRTLPSGGVTAKFLQVEGGALEVAQVLAAMMGAPVAPVVVEAASAPMVDPASPAAAPVGVVEDPPAPPSRPVVVPDPEPEADASIVPAGEVLEGGPFESAFDIPEAWRWVNDTGMTCHIRQQPGIAVAMCPQTRSKIGSRRLHDVEIPFKNTEVCSGCLRALEISRRESG